MSDTKIVTGEDYTESLRGRPLNVYLMGKRVDEPVDDPMLRPSSNAMAMTYDLALEMPNLATITLPFSGEPRERSLRAGEPRERSLRAGEQVNRFLHVAMNAEEVVLQNMLQRRLGQLTGTCLQRCVGMDAINALYSVTYEIDEKYGTPYHTRLTDFIKEMQLHNYVIGGAMTDVKGDRSKSPS